MRKILLSLGLLCFVVLCSGAVVAADEEEKPKKGKFGDRLKDKFGKDKGFKDKFGKGFGKVDTAKTFEKLDADKDDKISKEEFRKLTETSKGKMAVLEKTADRAFERLDKDKNGSLSKEEFKEFKGLDSGFFGGNLGDLKDKLKGFEGLKDKFGKKKDEKKDKKDD